jgi:hypothetical protein
MKIDLEVINDLSLLNIVFNTKETLNIENLEFLNLIFAKDGAYMAIKSNFGVVFDRTKLPYANRGLFPLFDEEDIQYSFRSFIRKPDISVLEEILEYFKFVCNKTKDELLVIVYYDTQTDEFINEIVKTQVVSGGSVEYAYNKDYEMDERYVKYLEIHSHHSMGASFSGTDNNDESNRTLYFCGVLGKINPLTTNIFNMDHKFRIWSGSRFIEIPIYEVFETHTTQPELSEDKIEELDTLLKVSNAIKERARQKHQKHGGFIEGGFTDGGFPDMINRFSDKSNQIPPFTKGLPELLRIESVRSAIEEAGGDPDDINDLDLLTEDELDRLPIEWQSEGGRALLDTIGGR